MLGCQPAAPAWTEPLVVRLLRCEERSRWRQLMNQHHYLGLQRLVGQSLCYVATVGEPWVALLAWGAAALKCQPRDAWIGWPPSLKWRRLHLIANNLRFLILPDCHQPNLASRILALNLKRLSADWERYYGHPILVAETFVDGARFQGTCYRAAGWQVLGTTRGFAKRGRGYVPHGRPKTVLVRPLTARAVSQLVGPFLPPLTTLRKENGPMIDVNRLPLEGEGGLIDLLRTLVDPRQPRGVRHPVVTIVAVAVCAALSGAHSFKAIAEWAHGLSRDTLKRLGSKRWRPPSEPTIRRVLQRLDADRLDAQIGQWLAQQHCLAGAGISVDGKTLRGGHASGQSAPHLLSALLHQEAVVLAQLAVEDKTNEIPKLPPLLDPLPLAGAVVTADALHTQVETARYLVETKQADYLFIVKDNQPTLRQDIADLNLKAFPPSAHHHR
ncbi:MAG TPA: ISAs1 family transposase [Candidatus Tectomicrobia bacterium]|nr:ISAs1 family transposase [Candidatus Tectomicrobia bacterium]